MSLAAEPASRDATSRLSAWAGGVAVAISAITPVFAYFGTLGFAALIALAGLLCLPLLLRGRPAWQGYALLGGLVAWAAASALWSPIAAWMVALKLTAQLLFYGAFVAACLSLSPRAAGRANQVLALGLLVIALAFIVEAAFQAPLHQWLRGVVGEPPNLGWAMRDLARTSYVLALLFWPAALGLARIRLGAVAVVLAASTVAGAYLLNADAPLAALAVSAVVFAAVRFLGRPALIAWGAGVAVYFLAAPGLIRLLGAGKLIQAAPDDIRVMSWQIRLDIWRFAAARIVEKPLFGWGLDAARTFPPDIPLHTHDGALQIWLELGAVGAVLATLFWLWLARRIDLIATGNRTLAAGCAACASAYLTIGALSFGVWQEWWLGLGALAIASCAALVGAQSR